MSSNFGQKDTHVIITERGDVTDIDDDLYKMIDVNERSAAHYFCDITFCINKLAISLLDVTLNYSKAGGK